MTIGKLVKWVFILGTLGGVTWLVVEKFKRQTDSNVKNAGANKKDGTFLGEGFVVSGKNLSNNVEAAGTLASNESLEIKSEINGRVTEILFKEGAFVSKGTLLVKLYDEDLAAQLKKLQSQKLLAEKTLERQQELLKISGISQQEVDITANQIDILNADISYNKALLQRTEIRAPFDGIIGIRNISVGAIVSSATVISTLQQTNPLKIDFSIPEKYRQMVKANDLVEFTVAGDPSTYKGAVYVVDPSVDQATRTVKMRAICNNPGGKLSPGAFANVRLILKEVPNALMIPSQAIIPGAREKKVIVAREGKATPVLVETGLRTENEIQITAGLQPGDSVLISGMLQVKPGMPIKFTNLKP